MQIYTVEAMHAELCPLPLWETVQPTPPSVLREHQSPKQPSVIGQEPPVEASIQFACPRSRPSPRNDRSPASRLRAVLPQDGHKRSVEGAIQFECSRSRPPSLSGRFPASKLTMVLPQGGQFETFE